MSLDAEPLDGHIVLPKRASFWSAGAVIVALAGQLIWAGTYVAKIESRFEATDVKIETRYKSLTDDDQRLWKRGDDRYGSVVSRLDILERDRAMERDRLVRLEEQVRVATDLLREIRQEIRTPRR